MKTTPLEYCFMSSAAYNRAEDGDVNAGRNKFDCKLQEKGWVRINFIPVSRTNADYQGIVYKHDVRREIVIAHRGTAVSFKNWDIGSVVTDVEGVIKKKIHVQMTACLDETLNEEVTRSLREGYTLCFTGHSLGGFLATLSLYFCKRQDLGYHWPQSRAIVFDPAGSQEMMELLEPRSRGATGLGKEGIENLDIMHFISHPNYVNSFNSHAGGTKYFITSSELNGLLQDCDVNGINYLCNTHVLENVLKAFDENTGYPKPGNCKIMSAWPLIDLSTLKSFVSTYGTLSFAVKSFIFLASLVRHAIIGTEPEAVNAWREVLGGEEYQRAVVLSMKEENTTLSNKLKSQFIYRTISYEKSLRLCHFSKEMVELLVGLQFIREQQELEQAFFKHHKLTDDEINFLSSFKVEKSECIILEEKGCIFRFRENLSELLSRNSTIVKVHGFLLQQLVAIPNLQENLAKYSNNSFYSRRWVLFLTALVSKEQGTATLTASISPNEFSQLLAAASTAAANTEGANYSIASAVSLAPAANAQANIDVRDMPSEARSVESKKRNRSPSP